MSLPKVVSQEEWTAARRELLEKEKELTRARDRLNTERRELPMVEATKTYELEGPEGTRAPARWAPRSEPGGARPFGRRLDRA